MPPTISSNEPVLEAGGRKGLGRLGRLPSSSPSPTVVIWLWSPWRLRRPSRACAPPSLVNRGAVQATLFVWGQPRASLCDRRRSARPAGRSQTKLNRAQYSGISAIEDYKPVMQRWSSQRQRYRPCPDAPGWPAISSCSPERDSLSCAALPQFIYAPFCSCLLRCPSCHTGRCPGLARSRDTALWC